MQFRALILGIMNVKIILFGIFFVLIIGCDLFGLNEEDSLRISTYDEIEYGYLLKSGVFIPVQQLGYSNYNHTKYAYLVFSNYSYVLRVKVAKNSHLENNDSFYANMRYGALESVAVRFYKVSIEDDGYVYMTFRTDGFNYTDGKQLFLNSDPSQRGDYSNYYILPYCSGCEMTLSIPHNQF
jgi:hypothetical protein